MEHVLKTYWRGTHRQVSPEETLARLRPLLPRMGITRLANVTGLDIIGIPVVMSVRPNSQSISVSQGKGLDLVSAKVSAAMESIEGYHAESIDLPLRLASYVEMRRRHPVVDAERLPPSRRLPFVPDMPLLWVEGQDWQQGEPIHVPFQMVHDCYTARMEWDLRGFSISSTGLASGNHRLEAVSHAVCEVVERDAAARFDLLTAEDKEARRLDVRTIHDPDCRLLLEKCDKAGVNVALWDITTDTGIAAVECIVCEREHDPHRPLPVAGGMGCHPLPEVALMRALTEAAQSRLTIIAGARDDMLRHQYDNWRIAENQRYWQTDTSRIGTRPFSALPRFHGHSFADDVTWELGQLATAGHDRVVVVDLTKPEFDIPVVRVIIPGMRHSVRSVERSRQMVDPACE